MVFITSSEAMNNVDSPLVCIFKALLFIVSSFVTCTTGGACYPVQADISCQYSNTLAQPAINGKSLTHSLTELYTQKGTQPMHYILYSALQSSRFKHKTEFERNNGLEIHYIFFVHPSFRY